MRVQVKLASSIRAIVKGVVMQVKMRIVVMKMSQWPFQAASGLIIQLPAVWSCLWLHSCNELEEVFFLIELAR